MSAFPLSDLTAALRVPPGDLDLSAIETDAAPGFDGSKSDGEAALEAMAPDLADLQERLFANGIAGEQRSILLVLQGMDTSGKGGTLRSTVGLMDPQGVRITSFKAPTREELAHDFLWRIRRRLPGPGQLGVFDRSHYEDVLIARVRELASVEEIEERYEQINAFEADLLASGTQVLKCMLHISPEKQKERLLERIDRPDKHWKFNPGDIDERERWSDYQRAYEVALERTSTEVAPWHVVPADRKWYRNLAIAWLLRDTLARMNPVWPATDVDLEESRRRLLTEDPLS